MTVPESSLYPLDPFRVHPMYRLQLCPSLSSPRGGPPLSAPRVKLRLRSLQRFLQQNAQNHAPLKTCDSTTEHHSVYRSPWEASFLSAVCLHPSPLPPPIRQERLRASHSIPSAVQSDRSGETQITAAPNPAARLSRHRRDSVVKVSTATSA